MNRMKATALAAAALASAGSSWALASDDVSAKLASMEKDFSLGRGARADELNIGFGYIF